MRERCTVGTTARQVLGGALLALLLAGPACEGGGDDGNGAGGANGMGGASSSGGSDATGGSAGGGTGGGGGAGGASGGQGGGSGGSAASGQGGSGMAGAATGGASSGGATTTGGAGGQAGAGGSQSGASDGSGGGGATSGAGGGVAGGGGGGSGGSAGAGGSGGGGGPYAGGRGGGGGPYVGGAGGGSGPSAGGVSGGGAGSTTDGGSPGGGAGGASGFALTSDTLPDGGTFPVSATCESTASSSQLPPLAWSGAPAGTKSFAMVFVDWTLIGMTPPNANGFHSAMWDIPATVASLPEGLPAGSPPAGVAGLEAVKQKKAPSGMAYLGPCPNFPSTSRTKTDTYQFRLYALAIETLPANTSTLSIQQIYNYLEGLPPLGVAILTGTSNAAGNSLK